MHNWFVCKIAYEKTGDEGKVIKVTETYLVDALSFTEAEARIIDEMKPYMSGEFTVVSVRRINIAELFSNDNGDKWYRCKVNFVTLDEEKGLEKRVAVAMLVQANDLKEACDSLIEGMKSSMADYEIVAIAETDIMDVYVYVSEKTEE